jgi:hypothetical protein
MAVMFQNHPYRIKEQAFSKIKIPGQSQPYNKPESWFKEVSADK